MKKIIFLGLFISEYISANAQLHLSSLQALLAYVDSNSIVIKSSVIQQNISASQKKSAQSYLYPSVNASGGLNDNLKLMPTLVPEQLFNAAAPDDSYKEFNFGKQYMYSSGVQVQWNLLNFQSMFAAKTADLQYLSDVANTQRTRLNTYNQLASDYYSIIMAQYSLEMYKRNLAATQEMLASANEKYQKGIISAADKNEVAIENLQNERNVNQAEQSLAQDYKQLQINLNTNEEINIEEDSSDNTFSTIDTTNSWSQHPEIKWQETQVALAESTVKEKKALLYPSLSIDYQYNYNWASNNLNLSSANHLPQEYVALKLNIPIFNGFANKEKIRQSDFQLQQQKMQLDNIKITEAKQDEILRIQYTQTKDAFLKNKEILVLQEQNDYYTTNQFKSGIISLDDRMQKYRDLLNLQNDYLQSLANYTLAQYKIYIRQLKY